MNATVLFVPLAMTGLMALIFHLLPRLARREICFAVTVPGAFRDGPEAARILLGYRLQVWIHALVAATLIVLAWSLGRPELSGLGLAWLFAGIIVAFLLARRAVQPHAAPSDSRREAELAPRSARLPGGWPGQLAPFVLLGLIGLLLYLNYDALPERWPVHWDIGGQADRWVERTPQAVFGSLAGIGAICALLLVVALGIAHHSRRIAVGGASAASERAFQRAILRLLLAVEGFIVLYVGGIRLSSLWAGADGRGFVAWLPVVAIPGLVLAWLLVFVRIGQGGSRLDPGPVRERPVGDRTSDDCWKLGLIYINRDDPAIFVEKRFGIGYTVNFGNYRVWLGLALLLALPVLIGVVRNAS